MLAIHRAARRLVTVLVPLLAAIALFGHAPHAFAHAYPDHSTPAPGDVLTVAPQRVDIWFTEHVTPGVSTIQVYDVQRRRVDRGDAAVDPTNTLHMGVELQPLPSGLYTVVWSNVSADDGHPNRGGFAFTVALPAATAAPVVALNQTSGVPTAIPTPIAAPTPLPLPSQSAQEVADLLNPATDRPTAAVDLVSGWLAFSAFVVTGGGAVFALYCLLPALATGGAAARLLQRRLNRRFFALAFAATGVGAVAALISLLAKAEIATGLPPADLFSGTVLGALLQPWAGKVWLAREAAFALTAIAAIGGFTAAGRSPVAPFAAGDTGSRPPSDTLAERGALALIAALGAVGLICQALDSHLAAGHVARQGPLGTLDLCLHLCAVGLWVGGLAYATAILWPAWRRLPANIQAAISAVAIARFSPLALGSVLLIVVTGTYAAILLLPSLGDLRSSAYGQALDIKIALLIVLILFGAANRRILAQVARKAAAPAVAAFAVAAGQRLVRAMRREFAVAAAALLAAGTMLEVGPPGVALSSTQVQLTALVSLPALPATATPPPKPTPVPPLPTRSDYVNSVRAGDLALRLSIDPAVAGASSTFQVAVTGNQGTPTANAEVILRLTAKTIDVGTQVLTTKHVGGGSYAVTSPAFALPGDWDALVVVRRDAAPEVDATFSIPVQAPAAAPSPTQTVAATAAPAARPETIQASLAMQPDPPSVGTNAPTIRLMDGEGRPIAAAQLQALWLMPQHAHLAQSTFSADGKPGVYGSAVDFSMAGAWLANVTLVTPDGRSTRLQFTFNVRDRGLFGDRETGSPVVIEG